MKLPDEFLHKMQKLMAKEEYEAFIKALKQKIIIRSLRVNTKKISVEEFKEIFPYDLTPVPWCKEGFYLPKGFKASKHPYYYAGLYYLQDPSAMLPVVALEPQSGEKILDLCAAPGGKSTQIGAAMEDGLLFMNDINPKRTRALLKNIENFGLKNIVVTNNQPQELAETFPAYFDRVLVDAPCSGEGMFRRESRLIIAWRRNYHPSICSPIQRELLTYAARMVAPGGRIVYSTCTFSPEEDELQIKRFLEEHPDFKLVAIEIDGVSPGRGEWAGEPLLSNTGRIWPHLSRGEGQFAAVLQKDLQGESKRSLPFTYQEPEEKRLTAFWEFCSEVGIKPPAGRLFIQENDLQLLPEGLPCLNGLEIVRRGLFLGELRYERFIPSPAFALALDRQEAKRQLELPVDSYEVLKYLRGDTLLLNEAEVSGEGWVLVTTNGFPLGWAKRVGNLIKNYYPSSWRMR
jgi:NOL1/NOP2/sun family putative RNA methylase